MAIWHPTKWWYQDLPARVLGFDSDELLRFGFGPQGEPWGQLDSGRYWLEYNEETGESFAIAPLWYQCLSCCCTPAKCKMPEEILMTLSGFDGTMSSIDYPSDYGYGPTNVCPCAITYVHNCEQVRLPPCDCLRWAACWSDGGEPGISAGCCTCRKRENYYWWPRDLTRTGRDKCSLNRPICNLFPHLCAAPAQTVKYFGRIAGRWLEFYSGCASCWNIGDPGYDGKPITVDSLIDVTDCAKAPASRARADYTCLAQIQSPVVVDGFLPVDYAKDVRIIINADSYLFPPGFKGVESKNLLPLCSGQFWNDSTYYRFCVEGGFWCDNFFEGFPDPRYENWRTADDWCEKSPTRCQGPVKVEEVDWQYYRPKYVLLSQPSRANCGSCFSGISNPLLRDDPFNPWSGSQDGHCNGKTDVAMADFNRTMVMRSRVYNAPPGLNPVCPRYRTPPKQGTRLIDARLLYETVSYGYSTARWHVDYPCEPKQENKCNIAAGVVQPKLRAFYLGDTGYRANIEFNIKIYCPPALAALPNYGAIFNGGFWYVSGVRIKTDDLPQVTEWNKGVGYRVGDLFVFDFYERPLRGGEAYWPTFFGEKYQYAEVTSVSPSGQILEIKLVDHNGGPGTHRGELPLNIGCSPFDPPIVQVRRPPMYGRYIPHRYCVAVAGNGYVEGDVLFFEANANAPSGNIETGSKFRPYLSTNLSVRSKARITVVDVDSNGGILDWHLCGAENVLGPLLPYDQNCARNDRGDYYDIRYADRCEYDYQGFLPVRYAWSGVMDVRFRTQTYCEHAWAEFFFRIQQISVKNDIQVQEPLQTWGRQAKLKITIVNPNMRINDVPIAPIYYQNYETSPGPNAYTDMGSERGYYRKHPLPITQGGVAVIEIVDPGAGYVQRLPKENPDDPDEKVRYAPLELSTQNRRIKIRSVLDDMRAELLKQGLSTYCHFYCTIEMDEESPNFGGIKGVFITQPGLWYFAHRHDHIWFAQAGSDWFFELASPIPDYSDDFVAPDCSVNISSDNPCCHATRDNWGELQHYDGFVEPYPSGYHQRTAILSSGGTHTYWQCDFIGASNGIYVWPQNPNYLSDGSPGFEPVGNFRNRWSTNFCPTDLLRRTYRMVLIHPCAACAKELGIPGAQTCWNMDGTVDSTYTPPGWRGTGTAMITRLASELRCRTSLIRADL